MSPEAIGERNYILKKPNPARFSVRVLSPLSSIPSSLGRTLLDVPTRAVDWACSSPHARGVGGTRPDVLPRVVYQNSSSICDGVADPRLPSGLHSRDAAIGVLAPGIFPAFQDPRF